MYLLWLLKGRSPSWKWKAKRKSNSRYRKIVMCESQTNDVDKTISQLIKQRSLPAQAGEPGTCLTKAVYVLGESQTQKQLLLSCSSVSPASKYSRLHSCKKVPFGSEYKNSKMNSLVIDIRLRLFINLNPDHQEYVHGHPVEPLSSVNSISWN